MRRATSPDRTSPAGDRTFTGSADAFVATAIVLADVKVLSIDQIADERQSTPVIVRAVTLEVDLLGAKALASAQSAGTLSLQLRRAGDVADNDNFKMPLHGLDESVTSAFEVDPGSSTAKVHRSSQGRGRNLRCA